jgi:hypothetical protein
MKQVVGKKLFVESAIVMTAVAFPSMRRRQIGRFPEIQKWDLQLIDHQVFLSIIEKLGSRVTHVKSHVMVKFGRQSKNMHRCGRSICVFRAMKQKSRFEGGERK